MTHTSKKEDSSDWKTKLINSLVKFPGPNGWNYADESIDILLTKPDDTNAIYIDDRDDLSGLLTNADHAYSIYDDLRYDGFHENSN